MLRFRGSLGFMVAATIACSQTGRSDGPAVSQPASGPAGPAADVASRPAAAEVSAAATKVEARTSPLPIGSPVTMGDNEMTAVDGGTVSIKGLKGAKGTLVIFTCNHCPYVKAWEPRFAKAGNKAIEMGFGVVAINANDPQAYAEDSFEEMKARSAKLGLKFPYAVDATSDIARAYGASKTPEVFLFDADDKLVYYGAIDDNYRDASKVEQRYLEDALRAVAAGEAVPKPVTKALGCSIKFREQA